MQQQCEGWKRPDDQCHLFKDGYSPMDIHQGYIGRTSFLRPCSSLALLCRLRVAGARAWGPAKCETLSN